MLSRNRGMPNIAKSPCRRCGEMCDSAILTGDLSKVICHGCLEKQRGIHPSQQRWDHRVPKPYPWNWEFPDIPQENPPKPRQLWQYSSDDGQACYFYAYDLSDPEKIWIDPGAIEVFLNHLYLAKKFGVSVYQVISHSPAVWHMLSHHWFVDDTKKEYWPRFWVGRLSDEDEDLS